jgi:hypothetical protein
VVKKDFFGRGFGALTFVCFEEGSFAFFGAGVRGATYMSAIGASKSILRRRGVSA